MSAGVQAVGVSPKSTAARIWTVLPASSTGTRHEYRQVPPQPYSSWALKSDCPDWLKIQVPGCVQVPGRSRLQLADQKRWLSLTEGFLGLVRLADESRPEASR